MMQAIKRADLHLELLLLRAPQSYAPSNKDIERLRADFSEDWNVDVKKITLSIASRDPEPAKRGFVFRTFLGAIDVYSHPDFYNSCKPEQITSLQHVLYRMQPDLIFAHRLSTMALIRRSSLNSPPIAFDLDDIESKAFVRWVKQPPHWRSKPLLYAQVPALARMERWAIEHSATTFVCSEQDAEELRVKAPRSTIAAIPNAVPSPRPSPVPVCKTVLFIGAFGYQPNAQAANLLTQHIWPLVRSKIPEAELMLAGRGCESLWGYEDPPPGVQYLGFVDDLDALYARTRVVVCPILSGAGTRIKIIEAALAGRPIVSTQLGAEGLIFSPIKQEIAHRDDVSEFASEVVRLLTDHDACRQMGHRAREVALKAYSEDAAKDLIVKHLHQCLNK